jgi:hypothetical protein
LPRVQAELSAVRAELDELQPTAEKIAALQAHITQLEAKDQELVELARAIPSERARIGFNGSSRILPNHLVDLTRLQTAFSAVTARAKSRSGDLAAPLAEFASLLNALIQERSAIEANVQDLAKVERAHEATINAQVRQIQEIVKALLAGRAGEGTAGKDGGNAATPTPSAVPVETIALGAPTRLLRWEKVDDSDQWKRVRSESVSVDSTELLRLFGSGDIPEGKLLSAFTARQYEIALKKINQSPENIAKAIRSESFGMGEPALLLIWRLPASPQELRNLTEFNGDSSALPDPERLAVELHRIPDFRENLLGMIELHRFDVAFQNTMQGLAKFNDGLKRLKSSPNLHRALSVVLKIGNALNNGTPIGAAPGFALNDVLELRYLKTNDKKVRLLHSLIPALTANGIDIPKVKAEADALVPASRVSLEGILESLKLAEVQLAHRGRTPFVVSSSQRIRDAINKVQEAQIARDRLTEGFGVREEVFKGTSLLQVLIDFAAELTRAAKENAARAPTTASAPAAGPGRQDRRPTVSVNVDETKSRGLIATMMGTMKAAATPNRVGGQADDEFTKAFAKVLKIVS